MASKINTELYTHFLLANQKVFSAVWLAELLEDHPAHDSVSRWLANTKLRPRLLWKYSKLYVNPKTGYLILDDSVYDKWYAPENEVALVQYSGTHHRLVRGIGIVTLMWTNDMHTAFDKASHIPVDYRLFAKKQDGYTKNEHFRHMLELAKHRGFMPRAVLFDAWYASLANLKLIRSSGWVFICGLQADRTVSLTPGMHQKLDSLDIPQQGIICHLKGFGFIKVIKIVRTETDIDYVATNELTLPAPDMRAASARRWQVEEYHRGVKQTTGAACCSGRRQRVQRNHFFCSFLAFLAMEIYRLRSGVGWYRLQREIVKEAFRRYLAIPLIPLPVPMRT